MIKKSLSYLSGKNIPIQIQKIMARLPRISPKGIPVHVIQRGNNRQACFVSDEDHGAYVGWLKEYAKKYGVDIHAWMMMTNHVHLSCTPQQEGAVSRMIRGLIRGHD